jgi:hypothetical protein
MDKQTKKVLIFGGLAIAVILGYKFLNKKADTSSSYPGGSNDGGGGGNSGGDNAANDLRLKGMANDLFDAMNQCGTDEVVIKDILAQVQSEQDFQGLIAAYGQKTVSSPYWCVGVSDFTGGLLGALKSELGSGDIKTINVMLQLKGVTTKI